MKQNKTSQQNKQTNKGLASLTYCGVSDECLPVGHHGVHRHLLVILTGDDRYSRLPTVLVPRPDKVEIEDGARQAADVDQYNGKMLMFCCDIAFH